jgi:hypothetical protein
MLPLDTQLRLWTTDIRVASEVQNIKKGLRKIRNPFICGEK